MNLAHKARLARDELYQSLDAWRALHPATNKRVATTALMGNIFEELTEATNTEIAARNHAAHIETLRKYSKQQQ